MKTEKRIKKENRTPKALVFAARNVKETVREPLLYVFCLVFPIAMLVMFQVIDKFSSAKISTFEPRSLVPGVMTFSFTFVMLVLSLLVSKDKSTALLKRLYSSPMKAADYVIGYALPCVGIGVCQAFACVGSGAALAAICGYSYFNFAEALLLVVTQLPLLLVCVFLGILIGATFNEKAAPGITSVFITASGVLGGAWMPLDTMGKFETFCRCLPFYPSVYWGRIVTGAVHTIPDAAGNAIPYAFDLTAKLGFIPVAIFLVASAALAFVAFAKQMRNDD